MKSFLLALLSFLILDLSYGQTPAPFIPTDKPNHEAGNPQQDAAASQRGTEQSPVVVKILPAAKDEAPPGKAAPEHKNNAFDWWLDHSPEIFIALFTLGLWCATYQLVRDAKRTAKHQLRAYMGVDHVAILDLPLHGEIVIKNFGQTMAKEMEFRIAGTVETLIPIALFPLGDRKCKTVVMPHEAMRFDEPIETLQPDIGLVKEGVGFIYLWGRIDYKDVFGIPHWTIFRFVTDRRELIHSPSGQYEQGWTVKTCDDGNDAT